MKPRPSTDVALADPWFKGEEVFAKAVGETQYLSVLDLLPADAKEARAAVTYARDGAGAVSLKGASLMFDQTDEYATQAPAPIFARPAGKGRLGGLVWQADAEVRKAPAILRGIARDLRQLLRERKVPASALTGAFAAGVVTTLMVGWIF
ncbi:MAG: hypothetical protein HYY06_32155 [Deltaproteobacteria bacterium]|nr:hypothetical protein [Deltaproteobacteria bacterium]